MRSNILVVGDVVQMGKLPYLDYPTGGWIGGMQEAHRTVLARANDATKIVPATGPVLTKAQVQASLDLLTKVREQLVKLMKQGKGAQDMIDAKAMNLTLFTDDGSGRIDWSGFWRRRLVFR